MTEEKNEEVVYKMSPKMSFVMGVLSGVAFAAIIGLFMMFAMSNDDGGNTTTKTNTNTAAVVNTNTAAPTPVAPVVVDVEVVDGDHIRGDINAPVALIQYSDFECPFSSRVVPTMEQVLEEYDGKVQLIYRHFPLSFHENVQKAAEASECAADQDKFWEMHDLIFANQDNMTIDDLKGYASDLGLNTSTFNDCLDNGDNASKVSEDFTSGAAIGVQGTPATFVNGTMVSGAQPYASFAAAIDAELAK
ncbi:MAG: thioredoxin domain-containing protein [Bacteroidota bacterium]|nr:thioredoxin domain-containing protein [Bacteroidota bacterium]